jgi:hypothetical protein
MLIKHMSIQKIDNCRILINGFGSKCAVAVSQTPQSAGEATDPRIVRSRQMLMDALGRFLSKKNFEDISCRKSLTRRP